MIFQFLKNKSIFKKLLLSNFVEQKIELVDNKARYDSKDKGDSSADNKRSVEFNNYSYAYTKEECKKDISTR